MILSVCFFADFFLPEIMFLDYFLYFNGKFRTACMSGPPGSPGTRAWSRKTCERVPTWPLAGGAHRTRVHTPHASSL